MQPPDRRADPVVDDAVDKGYVDSEAVYQVPGFATHAAANEGRLSVNRSAHRRNLGSACWVTDEAGEPCYRDCKDPQAPHQLRFRLHSKNRAREHVYRQSGGKPENLKYNPWKKDSARRFDDDGRPG